MERKAHYFYLLSKTFWSEAIFLMAKFFHGNFPDEPQTKVTQSLLIGCCLSRKRLVLLSWKERKPACFSKKCSAGGIPGLFYCLCLWYKKIQWPGQYEAEIVCDCLRKAFFFTTQRIIAHFKMKLLWFRNLLCCCSLYSIIQRSSFWPARINYTPKAYTQRITDY